KQLVHGLSEPRAVPARPILLIGPVLGSCDRTIQNWSLPRTSPPSGSDSLRRCPRARARCNEKGQASQDFQETHVRSPSRSSLATRVPVAVGVNGVVEARRWASARLIRRDRDAILHPLRERGSVHRARRVFGFGERNVLTVEREFNLAKEKSFAGLVWIGT